MFEEIKKCRICGCEDLKTILDLRQQKLTGVFPTLETHDDVEDAPLELVKCMRGCGLVQLRHSCDLSSMYGMNYGYRSGLNSSMVQHLTEITAEIKRNIHITKGDIILDIGSNDGTTLKSYGLEDVRLVGMDPTAAKFRQYYPDNVMVVEDYYSADKFRLLFGEDKAKVITSIAMFYDLESPVDFACSIADILADDGVWVFEQSYLPFMIDTMSFDTVCQEHLEYYTMKQIKWITDAAGLKIINVVFNDINGGSFRITTAKKESSYPEHFGLDAILKKETDAGYDGTYIFEVFSEKISDIGNMIVAFLEDKKRNGELVLGYGASTKGNVLLQHFSITSELLPAIAEVNPDKYGHVTPGTKIPIVSEEEAKKMKPDYFFVLPWHFKNNILEKNWEYMKSTGCRFVFPLPSFVIEEWTGNLQKPNASKRDRK